MLGRGEMGAANELRERERIAMMERRVPMQGRVHLPGFWADADVRRFLIVQHGFMTLDMARGQLLAFYGPKRAPSRSAIQRFWVVLDRLEKRA